MSLNAYLTLKGAQQGQIKGSVIQKGREGWIAVYAVHHEILSPHDAASGLATGKRQHKPILITKEIDQSTPRLLTALTQNEKLTEVMLRFFTASGISPSAGTETLTYTIKLTNATIVRNVLDMQLNKTAPGDKLPVLEQIEIAYQKIEWTWANGGITSADDWKLA